MLRLLSFLVLSTSLPAQDSGAEWQVIRPVVAESSARAKLKVQPDDSVLVTEGKSERQVHTFAFDLESSGLTALRIEAISDASLPSLGPGRGADGTFCLSELTISVAPRKHPPKVQRRVHVVGASATRADAGSEARRAIDGNPQTGWIVKAPRGEPQVALFEFARVLDLGKKDRLYVELGFRGEPSTDLGCVRFAVTSASDPLAGTGGEEDVRWNGLQKRVNEAIDLGVRALLEQQELDGSFRYDQTTYGGGSTALAVYTLLESGVPREHSSIQRALEFMRSHPPEKTYAVCTYIIALCAIGDVDSLDRAKSLIEQLVETQQRGWAYPDRQLDLSNTHYAALAFHYAIEAGLKVPKGVWADMARFTLDQQEKPSGGTYSAAGFRYRDGRDATGSMTAAGVGILAICERNMRRGKNDAVIGRKRGVQWLTEHFTVSHNPHPAFAKPGETDTENQRQYYFLYGLERVAGLLDLELFGARNWYLEGAEALLELQGKNGRWTSRQPNACFALLFLERATNRYSATGPDPTSSTKRWGADDSSEDVSLRARGDSPITLWISSFGDEVRSRLEADEPYLVRAVEYWEEPKGGGEPVLLTAADITRGDPRHAVQHTFARPGDHVVRVTVTLESPDGSPVELVSKPLTVRVSQANHEELAEYALDPSRNLLAGAEVTVTATSETLRDWPASAAVDNYQAVGWRSADDDPTPTLTLELEKPVRANTLLLSHAFDARWPDSEYDARIASVELTLNGKSKPVYRIDMARDDYRKTVLRFKKKTSVKSLTLRVLATHPGRSEHFGVGFNEVELQLRK